MLLDKRILLVEAHPDDIAWGCGGTIAKFKDKNEFRAISMTSCEEDPLNKGLLEENVKALNLLGVKTVMKNAGFERRTLSLHAQEIRDTLYRIKQDYEPEIVFCTSKNDFHQDHSVVGDCCTTIFRDSSTILSYPILRSIGTYFKPLCFVVLSKENMKTKLKALSVFKTQYRRQYFKKRIVLADSIYYGTQVNCDYAEALEIMEWVM